MVDMFKIDRRDDVKLFNALSFPARVPATTVYGRAKPERLFANVVHIKKSKKLRSVFVAATDGNRLHVSAFWHAGLLWEKVPEESWWDTHGTNDYVRYCKTEKPETWPDWESVLPLHTACYNDKDAKFTDYHRLTKHLHGMFIDEDIGSLLYLLGKANISLSSKYVGDINFPWKRANWHVYQKSRLGEPHVREEKRSDIEWKSDCEHRIRALFNGQIMFRCTDSAMLSDAVMMTAVIMPKTEDHYNSELTHPLLEINPQLLANALDNAIFEEGEALSLLKKLYHFTGEYLDGDFR